MKATGKIISMILVLLVLIVAAAYFGADLFSPPSKRIIGRFQDPASLYSMEFAEDGTVKADLPFKLASGTKLATEIPTGFEIKLGYQLVRFKEAKQDVSIPAGNKIAVRFLPGDKDFPWSKYLIANDQAERPIAKTDISGRKISCYKAGNRGPIRLYAGAGNHNGLIEGALFAIDCIDLDFNWTGVLAVQASYRFMEKNAFEIYLPLKMGGSTSELLLASGRIGRSDLRIAGEMAGIGDGVYAKSASSKAGYERQGMYDSTGIHGVAIGGESREVFINAGFTNNRLQNLRFLLHGAESFGIGKLPESPGEGQYPGVTVTRGADPVVMHAYERGIVEAGQTLYVLLRGWILPFKIGEKGPVGEIQSAPVQGDQPITGMALQLGYVVDTEELKKSAGAVHAFAIIK